MYIINVLQNAEVAELADALASGASDRKVIGVRLPSSAQLKFLDLMFEEFYYCDEETSNLRCSCGGSCNRGSSE